MRTHAEKTVDMAIRITVLAEDGLRSIDMTIAGWPAEFRAIVWGAVADIAARRARIASLKTADRKQGE